MHSVDDFGSCLPDNRFVQNTVSSTMCLQVLYYNARSLIPKLDELRANVASLKPHVVCVVETWLSEDISDHELSLFDYQLQRLDRNRHGGGILIYVHNSLLFKVLLQGGPHSLKFLALSISTKSNNSNTVCICLFYRPPSSPVSIFDNLCTTLQLVQPPKFSIFLLLGDFNVDFCNQQNYLFSYVNDIMLSFSLSQIVPSYTHKSPTGSTSLIDLALLSDTSLSQLQNCTTIPPLASSDHLGVSFTINWKPNSQPSNYHPRSVWVYKDADFTKANELILSTDWDSLLSEDVDQSAERWTQQFLGIMEKCIPRKHLKKSKHLPWLSSNIVRHIRRRNDLFQKASRSKDSSHFNKYKKLRNKVVQMIRSAKKNFFHSMTPSSKQFWKIVKLHNKNQVSIPKLSNDNVHADTDREKAEVLNAKCWNDSEPPLSEQTYDDSLNEFDIDDLLCTPDEIIHLINGLDTSKSTAVLMKYLSGCSNQLLIA